MTNPKAAGAPREAADSALPARGIRGRAAPANPVEASPAATRPVAAKLVEASLVEGREIGRPTTGARAEAGKGPVRIAAAMTAIGDDRSRAEEGLGRAAAAHRDGS